MRSMLSLQVYELYFQAYLSMLAHCQTTQPAADAEPSDRRLQEFIPW